MLKIIVTFILWTGALLGLGWGLERWVIFRNQKTQLNASMGRLLFLGFWCMAFFGQLIHLFFPLSQVVSFLILLLGWGIVFLNRIPLKTIVLAEGIKQIIGLGLMISLVAWVCYYNIDTGFYHLPTIAVLTKYSLLPGIANVFGPYGHNSTWFTIEALFTLPYLGLSSTFIANSVFVFGFLLCLSEVFLEVSLWSVCFFSAFLFCFNHVALGLGGVSPDLSITLLSSWVWFCFLESLFGEKKLSKRLFPYLLLYFTLALSIKISALSLCLPLIVIAFILRDQFKKREVKISLGLSVLFLVLWTIRGLMLSGCFLYPQSGTCFENLPWAMSIEEVTAWYRDIKKHLCGVAISGTIFSNPECFKEWMVRVKNDPIWRSCAVFVSAGLFYSFYQCDFKPQRNFRHLNPRGIVLLFCVLGVLVVSWLFSAPNLRFALWLVVAIVGAVIALVLGVEWQSVTVKRKRFFFGCLVILALGITLRSALVTRPIPLNWKEWPVLPQRISSEFVSRDGFVVSQPLHDFRCFEMSPPCTPQKSDFSIQRKWNRVWFKAGR